MNYHLLQRYEFEIDCNIIINADSINHIDSSAIHSLEDLINDCQQKGITLYFTGLKGPIRDAFAKARLFEKTGWQNHFMSVQEAVDYFDNQEKHQSGDYKQYLIQVNN